MEIYFLLLLIVTMMLALGSGFPVAFALPGSAIFTIGVAALVGYAAQGDVSYYFAGSGDPQQWLTAGVTNFRAIYWEAERDTLIAIPLFIFMGIMLQRSKIAEDLLVTMAQLFGPVPGGLGISVVFVGALLAATTGIVGATVVAMGLISLPAMMRNNYSMPLASGAIAASGTLGQIIPPSIVLIILADQLSSAVDQAGSLRLEEWKAATGDLTLPPEYTVSSTSAGDMFIGAFVPGLILVGLYMAAILAFALLRPHLAPAVHREGALDRKFLIKVLVTLVPPLTLIFVVLGSIIAGVATVNQAGAIGAVGATIMAGYRLRQGEKWAYAPAILAITSLVALFVVINLFDTNVQRPIESAERALGIGLAGLSVAALLIAIVWSGWRVLNIENTLRGVMLETAKTSALVFIILLGAAMLTAAFRAFGGEELVREFLQSLPGGFWTQFFIVMAVIFVLGFFLDFIEIAVVVVPIVAPILLADPAANVTAVWLGVMIGLNIQTSFLTPPFGFALFYLRGVAPPSVRTVQIYKGVIPFIGLQVIAMVIVAFFPSLVNYWPSRFALSSETAPPPSNRQLAYCVDLYLRDATAEQGDAVRAAIARARALDYSALPEERFDALTDGFVQAEQTFAALDRVAEAERVRDAYAVDYGPLHAELRIVERQIRFDQSKLADAERALRQNRDDPERTAQLDAEIAELNAAIEELTAQIPEDWAERRAEFRVYLDAVDAAWNDPGRRRGSEPGYNTLAENAYEPVPVIISALDTVETLAGFEDEMVAMRAEVAALAEPFAFVSGNDLVEAMDDVIPDYSERTVRRLLDPTVDRLKDLRSRVGDVPETRDITDALGGAAREIGRRPDPVDALEKVDEGLAAYRTEVAWRQAAKPLQSDLEQYEAALKGTIGLRSQDSFTDEQADFIASCQADHRDISLDF